MHHQVLAGPWGSPPPGNGNVCVHLVWRVLIAALLDILVKGVPPAPACRDSQRVLRTCDQLAHNALQLWHAGDASVQSGRRASLSDAGFLVRPRHLAAVAPELRGAAHILPVVKDLHNILPSEHLHLLLVPPCLCCQLIRFLKVAYASRKELGMRSRCSGARLHRGLRPDQSLAQALRLRAYWRPHTGVQTLQFQRLMRLQQTGERTDDGVAVSGDLKGQAVLTFDLAPHFHIEHVRHDCRLRHHELSCKAVPLHLGPDHGSRGGLSLPN
mmetsp:Transcript_41303/g.95630  ORF Transcript_41303/g.95630 Transcript_41303/m.95630 type:complete len:270 (-) Transcript_41303:15-824(-)